MICTGFTSRRQCFIANQPRCASRNSFLLRTSLPSDMTSRISSSSTVSASASRSRSSIASRCRPSVSLKLFFNSWSQQERGQRPRDEAVDDGAEEAGPEPVDPEAFDPGADHPEEQAVDDEEEMTEE